MADTRRGGGEQRAAGAQRTTQTGLKVEGDVVMEDADENPKSTGPAAGERGEEAAEYGGAGECGESNRAVGRETYRRYGEQSGAERAADGKQYRDVVQ